MIKKVLSGQSTIFYHFFCREKYYKDEKKYLGQIQQYDESKCVHLNESRFPLTTFNSTISHPYLLLYGFLL